MLNAQSTNGKDTARINLRARLREEATGPYAHFLCLTAGPITAFAQAMPQ